MLTKMYSLIDTLDLARDDLLRSVAYILFSLRFVRTLLDKSVDEGYLDQGLSGVFTGKGLACRPAAGHHFMLLEDTGP